MDNTTTRRAMLATLGVGGVAALTVPAIAATGELSGDDAAFFAKTKAMKAAEEAYDAFNDEVMAPAYDAFDKAREAVPHVTFEPDPSIGAKQSLSTSEPTCLAVARAVTGDAAYVVDTNSPDAVARYNRMERFAAAADARDAEIARLREKHLATARAREAHLGDIAFGLCKEVIEDPAPSLAALGWKIEHLWGVDPDQHYCEEWIMAIVADARRLLSSGRVGA
jgi:hypothetical protein